MAKQTFTTGQVLTAAQMTSLQQTAMGGGSTTDKTTSYVLVAADAGTTVIMNAAGATTITVNTALFAAGDTVNIQNIGAGICTVTAGTATVNTAGSLALNQYEGGVLYFRSTSAATFFDYVQTGSVSPLTTKGDLYGFSTLDARIPIGTNNQVLTADSSQALGLKWATASSAKTYSLINAGGTALTGATSVTVSSVTGDSILVHISGVSSANASSQIYVFFNADESAKYSAVGMSVVGTTAYAASSTGVQDVDINTEAAIYLLNLASNAASTGAGYLLLDGASTTSPKIYTGVGGANTGGGVNNTDRAIAGVYTGTSAITSVTIKSSTGNLDAGRVYIYGAA